MKAVCALPASIVLLCLVSLKLLRRPGSLDMRTMGRVIDNGHLIATNCVLLGPGLSILLGQYFKGWIYLLSTLISSHLSFLVKWRKKSECSSNGSQGEIGLQNFAKCTCT